MIELIASSSLILGIYLLAINKRIGWLVMIVSEIFWIVWFVQIQAYFATIVQVILIIVNVHGYGNERVS
jgi:hypothetical protein